MFNYLLFFVISFEILILPHKTVIVHDLELDKLDLEGSKSKLASCESPIELFISKILLLFYEPTLFPESNIALRDYSKTTLTISILTFLKLFS